MKIKDYFFAFMILCAGIIILLSNSSSQAIQEDKEAIKKEKYSKNISSDDEAYQIAEKELMDMDACIMVQLPDDLAEKDIIKALKLLIITDENAQCYRKEKTYTKQDRLQWYEDDICTLCEGLFEWIAGQSTILREDDFTVLIEILQKKKAYPNAMACVAEKLQYFPEKKEQLLPVLHELIKMQIDPDDWTKWREKKLKRATAIDLFKLGDVDTALTAFDNLAKMGQTAALGDVFHNTIGTKQQEKGIIIIRHALTYENKETKALAALFLIGLTQRNIIHENLIKIKEILFSLVEDILKNEMSQRFKDSTSQEELHKYSYGYSCYRALDTIIFAFKELKAKDAIPLLQKIASNPASSFLQLHARQAIKEIKNKEGK